MPMLPGEHPDIRNQWAAHLAQEQVLETTRTFAHALPPEEAQKINNCFDKYGNLVQPAPFEFGAPLSDNEEEAASNHPAGHLNFGIIGAGAAGLFMGMILDYLSKQAKNKFHRNAVEISYEILEANDEKRLGGRLYTHKFSEQENTHQYYDVGAMRFPENKVMERWDSLPFLMSRHV